MPESSGAVVDGLSDFTGAIELGEGVGVKEPTGVAAGAVVV